jgi:hypothetical protein
MIPRISKLLQQAATTLLLFLMALAGQAFATTYYLSPSNGSDGSGNGSFSAPWSSINKAMSVMTSNDDLQLRGGVYYYATIQRISRGGNSSHWVNIGSYNGERAVLDFTNQPRVKFSTTEYTAVAIESPNVYLYNITVQNAYSCNGITNKDSNVTIQGCEVYNCGGSGIIATHRNYSSANDRIDNILIQSCKVNNCVLYNSSNGNPKEAGWRTNNGGWPFALGIATATNARIKSCSSWGNYGEGIVLLRCAGSGLDVSNNWASTNWSVNIYLDNVYGSQATYARVAFNSTDNASGSQYNDLRRSGVYANGISVSQENYGWLNTGSFWIELNQNQASNSGNGYTLAEYTSPVSYIRMYGNKANSSSFTGYVSNTGNTNITWSTNYVNGVGTTGSKPSGK